MSDHSSNPGITASTDGIGEHLLLAGGGSDGLRQAAVGHPAATELPSSRRTPAAVRPTPAEPASDPDADTLLLKNSNPWDVAAIERTFEQRGHAYDRRRAEDLPTIDLAAYGLVVIPSAQPHDFYRTVFAERDRLDSFVTDGGCLIAHLADDAWPAPATWSGSFLPAGVDKVNSDGNRLDVLRERHPLMANLATRDCNGWNLSTHGFLTDLPETATVIAGEANAPRERPTAVEYPAGDGCVLATTQPVEWPWGLGSQFASDAERARQLLVNEIDHALARAETAPVESDAAGATV